ncbi:MAG: tyrosine--tRNA ligase [Chloroflexi bacterium]|nr:tyrosine--tRNA ligase [Chloroflexota bacterium]
MNIGEELRPLLRRGVAEVIFEEELVRLHHSGRPLRIKYGVDPSRPDLHLGHAVCLRKLRQLQDLGHEVIFIVGDWTAQIGDPSGQSTTRLMLSADEVRANAETYLQQYFKIVDRSKTKVVWQSQWFSSFTLTNIIQLTSRFTVAQLLAREDFARRYESGRPIAITELLYPMLQAYDSVAIEADVELGGTDQRFNFLVGRELQNMMGQPPQQIILIPLLVGTDGTQKMSKSLNNYIAFRDTPREMYGKLMSIPDHLILPYFELVTDVSDAELEGFRQRLAEESLNPMLLKQRLAREIVSQFYTSKTAEEAERHFIKVFQRREIPEDLPERVLHPGQLRIPLQIFHHGLEGTPHHREEEARTLADVADLLVTTGLARSRGEGKRLVAQRAVEIDGKEVLGSIASVRDGSVIRAGKRRFVRLRLVEDEKA